MFSKILQSRILLIVLCFGLSLTFAQEETASTSPVVDEHTNPRLKTPITLRAKDANLSEILKVLSERSGMNFVSSEDVNREKITIILNKTPLDEAINIIVRAAGLAYEIIGNAVLIAEPERIKEEVGQTGYVINLKYVPATEVAKMLSDLTKNIKVDEGGNRLICFTSPRVINEIERIIKAIDHPHILVMLETRIIEVSTGKLAEYGIDWNSLSSISGSIVYPESPMISGFQTDKWRKFPLSFSTSLDLLLNNNDGRILMDSKLTTTNNRPASLHIGDIVPYEIQVYNPSAGGGVNRDIIKEETGVKVSMTPHVNENNQVTLSIEPEVSSIPRFNGNLPIVSVRKAQTTIRVENGQTIFLAGLLSEQKRENIDKLPLLGQIPILGRLFQHRSITTEKTNLIIEITPRIIFDTKDAELGADHFGVKQSYEEKGGSKLQKEEEQE
ncbi:MAG: hypothetical protein GF398_12675 [Chitinivibrionales bacterium]|nr:hypothetical protein [Chitinivibrionales bacterium]